MEDDTEILSCLMYYLEFLVFTCADVIECLIIPTSSAAGFRREGGLLEYFLQYFSFLGEGNTEASNIFINFDTT